MNTEEGAAFPFAGAAYHPEVASRREVLATGPSALTLGLASIRTLAARVEEFEAPDQAIDAVEVDREAGGGRCSRLTRVAGHGSPLGASDAEDEGVGTTRAHPDL